MSPPNTNTQALQQLLERHPAVGMQRGALLSKLGLRRVVDLMFYFPRSYEPAAPLQQARLC
jgi:RecG-like helicase